MSRVWGRGAAFAWTAFSAFCLVGSLGSLAHERYKLTTRLNAGEYLVVEGVVEQFNPMPCGGHRDETFVVSGRHYAYSDFGASAGFHRSQCYGGPIREGVCVRIADVDGIIARLEVALSCGPLSNEGKHED